MGKGSPRCRESSRPCRRIQLHWPSTVSCASGHLEKKRDDDVGAITSFPEERSGKMHFRDEDKYPAALLTTRQAMLQS